MSNTKWKNSKKYQRFNDEKKENQTYFVRFSEISKLAITS